METLSEAHDDSSGANPSSVKSEDGSPPPDDDRGSPPPNCAICLGRCRNKSFTDSCLHQFCFKCLVTWSKVKTECPLCKQVFKSIIHNVQSNHQYEEYRVEQRLHEGDQIEIDDLVTATRRFRYRTTLTFPRGRDHIALQRLLMHYPPLTAMVGMSRDLPGITPAALPLSRRRRSPSSFRRTVYRHNLWARPLPDFTGRHRDCTPEFYRHNDSQMHRLVPWLERELHYLLLENAGHITYVQARILDLLPRYHITSPEFRAEIYRYLGGRTDHFLHELHCFASTPYDLTGYDRNVQYTTDSRVSSAVNDVHSSSDTESGDSDIVIVTAPTSPSRLPMYGPHSPAYSPFPGPSAQRAPEPVYPRHRIAPVDERRDLVVPIETISHSDTDDDEVMVTGYIKPPSQRTPEVVDLRDSDSDVVLTEEPAPPPPPRGLVQLTVSRAPAAPAAPAAPRIADSDSEGDVMPPLPLPALPPLPAGPRARRRRSSSSYRPSSEDENSQPSPRRTPRFSSDSSEEERVSSPVRRYKRKRTRRSRDAERERADSPAPAPTRTPERDPREKDKRKKSKSTNGKGVKSSRKADAAPTRAAPAQDQRPGPSSRPDAPEDRPGGPFGNDAEPRVSEFSSDRPSQEPATEIHEGPPRRTSTSRSDGKGKRSRIDEATESQRAESASEARPSSRTCAGGSSRRKDTEEGSARRNSREKRRLKSVVKKTSSWSPTVAACSAADLPPPATATSGPSRPTKARKRNRSRERRHNDVYAPPSSSDFTDSDDDIPLNLTIQRSAGHP